MGEQQANGPRAARCIGVAQRLLPALAVFACACAFVVQAPGWAQTSYMALGKALLHGSAQIDPWH